MSAFRAPIVSKLASPAVASCTDDWNLDGKPDLIMASLTTAYLITNNGGGTYQLPVTAGTWGYLGGVRSGDFNGDGSPDLVLASDDLELPTRQGSGVCQHYRPLHMDMG